MGITDVRVLENWLWEAACKIRGEVDAPKYKDYILPLIFIKRLSDVFEDEVDILYILGENQLIEAHHLKSGGLNCYSSITPYWKKLTI